MTTNVENNLANNSGGGMSIKDDADLIVLSSSISNNETDGIGGGVYITNASPSFEFVLIANNSSSSGAGAYIRNESNVNFSNLTLVNNSCSTQWECYLFKRWIQCYYK